MRDPMWFNQVGWDPIDQQYIFKLSSRDEVKDKIAGVLEEWPRYGPAIYEKAARAGRLDIVEILLELGAESDPKTMKRQEDDEDEDVPLLEIEHAYLAAIFEGHLDIIKMLVEKGSVPVNYEDDEDGLIAIPYAASKGHTEIVRWLLDHGATITLDREGDSVGDLSSAIKGGKPEIVKIILDNPQTTATGRKIEISDLPLAAYSGSVEVLRFVLQSDCFGIEEPDAGLAGQGTIKLTEEQNENMKESLVQASSKADLESISLLLKQLTPLKADGSFEPFRLSEFRITQIFNATEDGIEETDMPKVFEILWDTVLHQPPESEESVEKRFSLPVEERLSRRLISACANGRVGTVKLLVEKYSADINHVSHKYFTSPLSRAAASGANPVPGRLEVVEYLCSRPELDMDLSVGEYCNGETALALTIGEANYASKRKPEQAKLVRLLLQYGGPVDDVDDELRKRCDEAGSGEQINVYVLWAHDELRRPVKLFAEDDSSCTQVVLEYSARELRNVLRGIKIRKDDATLQASDPRKRPLMPPPGEELAEDARAQPTLVSGTDIRSS